MSDEKKRPCFVCNGTGEMCDTCGEAVNACSCDPDDGEPGSVQCEDCGGSGIAAADQAGEDAK